MSKFEIKAKWSVYATLSIEAEDLDEALQKITDNHLFTEYSSETYGLDDHNMSLLGIEVVETEYDGPSPTGRQWTQRDWEWDEMDPEEE